jgi:elongation factor G
MHADVTDGVYRHNESNDAALIAAASQAFRKAVEEAGTVILEPVMKLVVTTPDQFVGEVMSDLNTRRAEVRIIDRDADNAEIEALIPVAETFGYTTQLRSISQGRAAPAMEPSHYQPAPPDVQERFTF